MPKLFLTASIVGKPEELSFDSSRSHTFCRLCGAVFQGPLDRYIPQEDDNAQEIWLAAYIERQQWSERHAKTHSETEHRLFALSGRFLSPAATEKLVPFGIIPFQDILEDEEVEHAGRLAARMPNNDAEQPLKGGISIALLRNHL